jgi:hypothetical protein
MERDQLSVFSSKYGTDQYDNIPQVDERQMMASPGSDLYGIRMREAIVIITEPLQRKEAVVVSFEVVVAVEQEPKKQTGHIHIYYVHRQQRCSTTLLSRSPFSSLSSDAATRPVSLHLIHQGLGASAVTREAIACVAQSHQPTPRRTPPMIPHEPLPLTAISLLQYQHDIRRHL